jgi:diguanylate cyclase (GGDEF)-like protein
LKIYQKDVILSIQRGEIKNPTAKTRGNLRQTMSDAQKLYTKAEKLLARQKFTEAYEALVEVYRLEPNDEHVLTSLSDLAVKLNRPAEAIRFGAALTDFYLKRNDVARAIASCRKVLKVSSQDLPSLMKLAPLLERSQKTGEALEVYREALSLHLKAGSKAAAIECLQHVAKLDPDNIQTNLQLGELASQNGDPEVASEAYLRAAQLARAAGQADRWEEWSERSHQLNPGNPAAAMALAEVRVNHNQGRQAISLVEPLVARQADDLAALKILALAYVLEGEWAQAEPLAMRLFQSQPDALALFEKVIEGFLGGGETTRAMELVQQIRSRLFEQGKRQEFLALAEKIFQYDETNIEIVELLTVLYNEMNREEGLRRSLTRLFNLYLAGEQYERAADTLERIVDVDPYGPGHGDRLLNLEGHIDPIWYRNIASRIQVPSSSVMAPLSVVSKEANGGAPERKESLEDLTIEGEMFHQYQLTPRLMETLEKIDRLYPGAYERNARLRDLFDAAGFHPKSAPSAPATPAAYEGSGSGAPAPSAQSLDHLQRVSEITAHIFREATPLGVLQVAADQIGKTLNASRCWAAMGSAERGLSLAVEFCNLGVLASESAPAAKVFAFFTQHAMPHPEGWTFDSLTHASEMAPIFLELNQLGIKSLVAFPLMDQEQVMGLLRVDQCDSTRFWTPGDLILIKAVAPQIVIGVNNTQLRRLVKSLAGSDPETGLLPRASYLDCLLAEANRAKEQRQPLTVCLIEPEETARLAKELGDARLQSYAQRAGKALTPNLRQNDMAIRYGPCTMAVVFPDTDLDQASLAVEKVRRVLGQIKLEDHEAPRTCAVICDVPLGSGFDAVDGVTEVINRLEALLEEARKNPKHPVMASRFQG